MKKYYQMPRSGGRTCYVRKCVKKSEYESGYTETVNASMVGVREKKRRFLHCREHAIDFSKQHGLGA